MQKRLGLLNEPCSFPDAVNFIIETTGIAFESVQRISKPHIYDWSGLEKFIRYKSTPAPLKPFDKAILDQLDKRLPLEWINEGISVESMLKYQIGYYERTCATTIPCFDEKGELIGIRVRNWRQEDIEDGKKYVPLMLLDGTMYNFPTNRTFYGLNFNHTEIERTGKVFLAEGEKSILKLDTIYGEKNVGLAMYGKNLGQQRRNKLVEMGVNTVIYIADNDWIDLGQEAYDKWEQEVIAFGKQFKGYCNVEVVWDNLGLLSAKDNALDKDLETWQKLYDNREVLV